MGIRFVIDEPRRKVALFDSVSGFAFGPVLESEDDAEHFLAFATAYAEGLEWEHTDARAFSNAQIAEVYARFVDHLQPDGERER